MLNPTDFGAASVPHQQPHRAPFQPATSRGVVAGQPFPLAERDPIGQLRERMRQRQRRAKLQRLVRLPLISLALILILYFAGQLAR